VCGLIAAKDGRAMQLYRIDSVDASPVTYRMDPKQQLRAMTDMDDRDWDLGAIYHSHTHTQAFPSPTDIRLAFYPETLYAIVSLADPDAPDFRAFRIDNGDLTEVALEFV
jgi:proteasome lid subunit RPN8/RPN11